MSKAELDREKAARERERADSSKGFSSSSQPTTVGSHFRVGRKIGEGSFGVIYEGTAFSCKLAAVSEINGESIGLNLLNSTSVAIKFVRPPSFLRLFSLTLEDLYLASGTSQIGGTAAKR